MLTSGVASTFSEISGSLDHGIFRLPLIMGEKDGISYTKKVKDPLLLAHCRFYYN